jgi:hypothetical protein
MTSFYNLGGNMEQINDVHIQKKKNPKVHSSHRTEKPINKRIKTYIKKYGSILFIMLFMFLSVFSLGMYIESKTGYLADSGALTFLDGKQYESVEFYELSKPQLKRIITKFITQYFNEDDPEYVDVVTNSFIRLFNKVPEDRQNILYYIALCSVESNFKMSARSGVGAVGISQVMWSVWGDIIKKNYGVTREKLYTSPYDNIYVGYMIWRNYWKKANYNIKEANAGYLGANSSVYNSKISERHSQLVNMIFKEVFKQKTKIKTVEIK